MRRVILRNIPLHSKNGISGDAGGLLKSRPVLASVFYDGMALSLIAAGVLQLLFHDPGDSPGIKLCVSWTSISRKRCLLTTWLLKQINIAVIARTQFYPTLEEAFACGSRNQTVDLKTPAVASSLWITMNAVNGRQPKNPLQLVCVKMLKGSFNVRFTN